MAALPAAEEGAVLLDGKSVPGRLLSVRDGAVLLDGRSEPIPLYELSTLVLPGALEEPKAIPFDKGPIAVFREGEVLQARVLDVSKATARLHLPATGGTLNVPTDVLKGFRLREVNAADELFESDLKEPRPPEKDIVYVRRGAGLLRVQGVFEGLDEEYLTLEFEGEHRRLRRALVLGVLFAPLASADVDSDIPAVFEVVGSGHLPASLSGARGDGAAREVLLRFRGAPAEALEALPAARVREIRFSSDRVLFLSAVQPGRVEETPLFGTATSFPWRRDLAASGGPLQLGGRVYRRGLGVHSRSVLEYELDAKYRSFAAVIGLDDTAQSDAGVTFRVAADGKEIFQRDVRRGAKPESVLLPVGGVKRLQLQVDYGPDGVDFGDHANWADARVAK
ncbi:MAG TPA: NPCBM/NEW2 domain-containing protein [Planctomycetota bacterium]|nr:NPCBM/NEW2 domain-containing protein [Planctomycetota bacterium]